MMKEELYKLSLDSYTEYPLLAELMAIRDERFKDEQQDSMLCVNGYVGLDTLNNYVKLQQANQHLKDKNTQLRIEISAREEEYRKLERTIQGLILFAWQSEMNESEYNRFCAIAGEGVNNE